MKRTISALAGTFVAVTFVTTIGAAQTQRQLDEKYPKVNAYLVRPNTEADGDLRAAILKQWPNVAESA